MEAGTWFPVDFVLSHVPFCFLHFSLYYFMVINISLDYKYMLNSLGPPRKSVNLGAVLGTLDKATKNLTWSLQLKIIKQNSK